MAAYVALCLVAWVIWPLLIHDPPSGDNFEQLRWAEHLAWGYDKHPPLPTMILWIFEQVFPTGIPLTFALGGLQVATVLGIVWWLTRRLLDDRRALIAVLLASCITYYSNRMHYYNHNTALLVAYALSVACTFKAAQSGKWIWYALLGATWGAGLLSKYQMVIGIACNAIFLCWFQRREWRLGIARLVLACGVCALVITPHYLWLVEHHFPSFDYAAKSVAAHLPLWQRPADIIGFGLDQLMRIAPIGVVLLILRRLPSVRAAAAGEISMRDASAWAASFLRAHTWGPLALMSSLSLLFGTDLQMHWGTAFIWTFPIWLLRTRFGRAIATVPMKTLCVAVVALQLVSLLAYLLLFGDLRLAEAYRP